MYVNNNSPINTINELDKQIFTSLQKTQTCQLYILEKIGSEIKKLRIDLRKVKSIKGSCLNLRKVRSDINFENSLRMMNYRVRVLEYEAYEMFRNENYDEKSNYPSHKFESSRGEDHENVNDLIV